MSAQSKSVSEHMQSVWAAFAKDPENGPISKGWPAYDPESECEKAMMTELTNDRGYSGEVDVQR